MLIGDRDQRFHEFIISVPCETPPKNQSEINEEKSHHHQQPSPSQMSTEDSQNNNNSNNTAADDKYNLQLDDTVLRMLLDTHPWPETIANLHKKFEDNGNNNRKSTEDLKYLVEKVLPTLIPAMSELSEVIRRDVDSKSGHPAAPPSFPPTRSSPGIGEGPHEATGVVHPVVWLAQRLMRGGNDRGVVSDAEHPFCELLKRAPPTKE